MEETGITKEFLEEVLKFPVDRFEVTAGQNAGDGYTCALHSVAVYPQDGDSNDPLNIVIKCFPNNEARQELLENSSIFEVELGMYQEVIPELRRFQEEAKIENIVEPPFPKFYYGRFLDAEAKKNLGRPLQGLDNCIIMPDLRTKDNGAFRLRNRLLGLDHAHYQLSIAAHAKLHALSWAYKQITGTTLLKRFPFFDMTKVHDAWESMKGMNVLIFGEYRKMFADEPKLLAAVEFLEERYMDVLREAGLMKRLEEGSKWTKDSILKKPVDPVEGEEPWLVLLHGDAWSNNMMFRYDEQSGRPVECLLVDLQMSREGDPICDLQYTLYACTSREFRQKHLESMLHLYHDTFLDVCRRLGVPPLPGFTFQEFKRRFNRAKIFGSAIATMALLAIMKPPEEALDMEKIEVEESVEDGEDKMAKAAKMFEKVMISQGEKDPRANKPLVARMSGMLTDMIEDGVL